jgi:membrane protein
MSSTSTNDPPPEHRGFRDTAKDKAVRGVNAASHRVEGTWIDDLVRRLKNLHPFDWTTVFSSTLLLSLIPLIIVLASLANQRIDDDLSRHIGLDRQSATIVERLFRTTPTHAAEPVITGVIIGFAGTVAMVASLQVLYERVFEQESRSWHNLRRWIVWVLVLLAFLIADGAIGGPVRTAAGHVVQRLVSLIGVTIFFGWTIHFLLAGRIPWRRVVAPAILTALLWLGLSLFSSLYFSPLIKSDNRLYGTIGVVFSLVTWLIIIGAVIMAGAVGGVVWQEHRARRVSDQR